jgi:hypothetical protein
MAKQSLVRLCVLTDALEKIPKTKSPKTMETFSTVIMFRGIFDSVHQTFVKYLCIDDDTIMMLQLCQKCDGGNLPDYMPVDYPIQISDLNYRIQTIGHIVFDLARATMEKSRVIMHVAYHLKRALSYFINGMVQNKCDSKTFVVNTLGPLEHLFGNHKFCTEQCPGKKAYMAKEEYSSNTTLLDKKMHRDIYLDLLEVTDPYFQSD